MTKNVAPNTDNSTVELDELTPWEEFRRKSLPKGLSPKSPYSLVKEREFHYKIFVKYEDLRSTLFDRPAPIWHDAEYAERFNQDVPRSYSFVSSEYTVRLTREPGMQRETGLALATFRARLSQLMNSLEPGIETWLNAAGTRDDGEEGIGNITGSRIKFSLDEATEVAHLLLLLVDVARDTTDRAAGEA